MQALKNSAEIGERMSATREAENILDAFETVLRNRKK
jgi:hypothetical protein